MTFSTSFSFSSSSHYSYSSANGATRSGHVVQQSTTSNPSGTTIHRKGRQLGGPTIQETQRYDGDGNPILENGEVFVKGRSGRAIEERDRPIERRIKEVADEDEGGKEGKRGGA